MANKFYSVVVKDVEKTTDECSVVSFELSDEVKSDFRFRQGQYLTLRAKINGEDVRRSYSLCSSPVDDQWKVAIKKIDGGKFSTFANDVLKKGDVLEVMPPNGRFFVEVDSAKAKNYVAFAAGSGITPILSIIKTHLTLEPESTFQLFYVNRSVSTIILKEEIEGLKNRFLDRLEIFHFLTQEQRSTPLFNGRLDEEKMETIYNRLIDVESIDDYFICGPTDMIFMIRDFLQDRGIDSKKIHFELFNTNGSKNATKKKKREIDTSILSQITVREGGKDFNFTIPRGSDNILDAALNNNADLPFACKGGVCCTCRAKLIEGQVEMEVNYALEKDEVEAGYILTCQSVPVSEKVVVDFEA
ncbi:MAG: phenylacetate-CoA oxygenase/reductase subunit PaaK [Saprospiraceae bacterium]|nr:phenylacetate-CoA oxygenase/reductase subunit PaaK [Saprospiraceae bacterium]